MSNNHPYNPEYNPTPDMQLIEITDSERQAAIEAYEETISDARKELNEHD